MPTSNTVLTLKDLPPPPPDKSGWPWTEQTERLPKQIPGGYNWPLISIVTPSYNQGQFLEETIRSVLLQGYPNLEYIIIDGGSEDDSVEIIKKYECFLAYWISEPDNGQTHAINKGIERASGEIFTWLNSDDIYTSGALYNVGKTFQCDIKFSFLYGKCEFINSNGEFLFSWPYFPDLDLPAVISDNLIPQSSCFLDMQAIRDNGPLNEQLHYSFDYEYWLRLLLNNITTTSIPILLSCYRLHQKSKTQTSRLKFDAEMELIHEKLLEQCSNSTVKRAVAKCYRRFSTEYYYWFNDKASSIFYFHKMLQIDPLACSWLALKVYIRNLINKRHHA